MNARYVVQVNCTGMGWVDSRYSADERLLVEALRVALLENDSCWMPGPRQTRILDTVTGKIIA